MSKRFTDTEKWDRPWFRNLSDQYKLLWCYILDRCDIAGVWYIDMELASFQIGKKFDRQKSETTFQKQIEVRGDRWLIRDFIPFQYGSLDSSNKVYKGVSAKLNQFKEGASMPLRSPIDGGKDKDKEKDKDKVKEGGMGETTKQDSELQKVVKGWKFLNGLPTDGPESQAWDRVHFARHAKSAKSLLDLFGYEDAVNCMEYVFSEMSKKKLTCTIETIVKHSDSFREKLAGRNT